MNHTAQSRRDCTKANQGPVPQAVLCQVEYGVLCLSVSGWGPAVPLWPSQVALDVIEGLCTEMALTRPEAIDENVIFVVNSRGE